MAPESRKAVIEPSAAADEVINDHPELVERLNDGDPSALLELLEAAGGKVGQATIKVVDRPSTAATG